MNKTVIGVDFDGTLVEYHGWEGMEHYGAPVPKIIDRMRQLHETGEYEFWIFSARIDSQENADIVKRHCAEIGIDEIIAGYTNIKHKVFREIWDDRAKQVIPNVGQFIEETPCESFASLPDEDICKQLGITPKALKVARLMSLPVFNYQHGGSYYKDMLIEPAVYVAANKLGAEEGNVIKYTSRHPFKNGEQDVDKAIHNLQMIKETRY